LGGLLCGIADVGAPTALERLGIGQMEGHATAEVVAALVDYLCGSGATLQDSDVRQAATLLLMELLEGAEAEGVAAALEQAAAAADFNGLLERFYAYVLYWAFVRVHSERVLGQRGDEDMGRMIEDLKTYIRLALRQRVRGRPLASVDWLGAEGQRVAEEILEATLAVYGG